jgi:hypothetical protein
MNIRELRELNGIVATTIDLISGSPTGIHGSTELNGSPTGVGIQGSIEPSLRVVNSEIGAINSEIQTFGMPYPSVTLGGLSISMSDDRINLSMSNEAIIQCPVHGSIAGAETLRMTFPEGTDERYCLRCLRDQLRKTVAPLGEAVIPLSDSSSIKTLSRYDILRRENDEKTS